MSIYKCYFPDCLINLFPTHNSAKSSIIYFKEEGYTGDVNVAVISNDSRLGPQIISQSSLGVLPHPKGLTNWRLRFNGLMPEHYYALVIYGTDLSRPFYRSCFLADHAPVPG